MDTFPYQHHPSMLEAYLPNLSKQTTSYLETEMGSSSHSFYPSNPLHGSASSGNHLSYSASCKKQEQNKNGTDRKRKNRRQSCSDPGPTKNANDTQWKKQKKSNISVRDSREKLKSDKNQKTTSQQPPSGYIHVRARRGQATDSHSLAERVRREKISQRMKLLQGLVPGCDKVTGKALMLDAIINYAQSLQNQVEFLSMKLASLSPLFFDLCEDADIQILQSEMWRSLSSPSQSTQQSSYVSRSQIGCLPTMTTPPTIALPNRLLENAASVLVPGLNHANGASTSQDSASLMWEGQHQVDNLCYFKREFKSQFSRLAAVHGRIIMTKIISADLGEDAYLDNTRLKLLDFLIRATEERGSPHSNSIFQ